MIRIPDWIQRQFTKLLIHLKMQTFHFYFLNFKLKFEGQTVLRHPAV